jgi:6-phosphogluconolactonase (cycloisomerase 2 family)
MFRKNLVVCLLILGSLMAVPVAFAASTEFVYVESNIQSAGGNSIYAFQRNADGSLTQIAGSPFPTGGAGVQDTSLGLGPYDSDQNVVVDADRKLLFAVNSGSDTIAVFHIKSGGSLEAVNGSPFPSQGTNPVSIGVAGDILFAVNKNGDFPRVSNILPNYTSFHIAQDGSLLPIAGSTVSVGLGTSPTQALVVPGTNLVFGADFFGGLMQSFRFDSNGHLHQNQPVALPASEFPDPTAPRLPLGLITHPHQPLLYVGLVTINRLGVYKFDGNGYLHFVRSASNSGVAICWIRTNKSGTRLYTTNTASATGDTSTISVYDISDPDAPREIQNVMLAGQGNARQFELSGDGKNLYAVTGRFSSLIPNGQGNALHVFSIGPDGMVEETSTIQLPVPAGVLSQGVAVYSPR